MVQSDHPLLIEARQMTRRLDLALDALDAGQLTDVGYAAPVEVALDRDGEPFTMDGSAISPLGLRLHTSLLFGLGDVLWVRFPSPDGLRQIEARARVMAVDEQASAVALELQGLRREDWQALWLGWSA